MRKILSITLALALITLSLMPSFVADTYAYEADYGSITLNSNGATDSGHFNDIWDLGVCDMTISFEYDANGLVDDSGTHAWSAFGVREVGYPDFNPTYGVEGAGVWLATDYDWGANTFDPDPVGVPAQDIDDKLLLQKAGGHGEGDYNLPGVPPISGNNHRFWFDRDGVDQWQAEHPLAVDGGTYNTEGTYNIVLKLHATSATQGEAYMAVNGLDQGFETDGNWSTMELTPAGMTFTGDMSQMQVYYGLYGYGANHSVSFNNISVEGCKMGVTPDKVVGGAEKINAAGTYFSMAVNAVHTGKGDLKGKIQYSRDAQGSVAELYMHAETECVGATEDGSIAVVAGPARAQSDPDGYLNPGDWLIASIMEGGNGSGDRVRIRKATEEQAMFACQYPSEETAFPGLVEKGNFQIKL